MTSASSSPTDPQLDLELQRLLAEYLPRLQGLGAELLTALAAEPTPENRERARKLAHRIHGTSGSYGLAEIAAAAGAIEDAYLDGDFAALPAAAAAFETALASL
jgi:HPt (histidine-containing phosphotransfer) domain-containing protein